MSTITIHDAEQLVSPPSWATAPDYRRRSDFDGSSDDVFILETATIVDTPLVAVQAEWQTTVRANGSVEPTLESVRLLTSGDDGYIETPDVAAVIRALAEASQLMGVAS